MTDTKWIFKFEPITPLPNRQDDDLNIMDTDSQYPAKLRQWIVNLNFQSGPVYAQYDANAFTVQQRVLYMSLFSFYGEQLLDDEIRIYSSLLKKPTDEYLKIALRDYLTLQNELQNLIKFSQNLVYINSIERREMFIRLQRDRITISVDDLTPYTIPKFTFYNPFPTIHITKEDYDKYRAVVNQFSLVIQKIRRVDPFGQMYMTRIMNLTTIQVLMKKFPKFSNYFSNKTKMQKIISNLVDNVTSLDRNIEELRELSRERLQFSVVIKHDLLIKQQQILTSDKPENILKKITQSMIKLNQTFLKFNTSATLVGQNKDTVNISDLIDNFFYSDYMVVRDSIDGAIKSKFEDILETIK